jgi:hypothetical protein
MTTRPDLWPGRTVEAVDTRRQRLYDDPGLGNREPGAPTPRNVYEAQAQDAREHAPQVLHGGEGPVLYWATIQLRNGKLLNRTTRRSGVAAEWHREPALKVIQHGTGRPPWETLPEASQAAPSALPVLSVIAEGAADAPAPDGECLTSRNNVAAFEAAASAVAAPAHPAGRPAPPDECPEITDELVARVFAKLELIKDKRVRNEVGRLRAVLAELHDNAGQARHKKYRIGAPNEADALHF